MIRNKVEKKSGVPKKSKKKKLKSRKRIEKAVLMFKVTGKALKWGIEWSIEKGREMYNTESVKIDEKTLKEVYRSELKRFQEQKLLLEKNRVEFRRMNKQQETLKASMPIYETKWNNLKNRLKEANETLENGTDSPYFRELLNQRDDIGKEVEEAYNTWQNAVNKNEELKGKIAELVSFYVNLAPIHNEEWEEFKRIHNIQIKGKGEKEKKQTPKFTFKVFDTNTVLEEPQKEVPVKEIAEDLIVDEKISDKPIRNIISANPATISRAESKSVDLAKETLLFEIQKIAEEYNLADNHGLKIWTEKDEDDNSETVICYFEDFFVIAIEKETSEVIVTEYTKNNHEELGAGTSLQDIVWNDDSKKEYYEKIILSIYNNLMKLKYELAR